MYLYEKVRIAFAKFAKCEHQPNGSIYTSCLSYLHPAGYTLEYSNPVLFRMCIELCKFHMHIHSQERKFSLALSILLKANISLSKNYLQPLQSQMKPECTAYAENYGSIFVSLIAKQAEEDDDIITGTKLRGRLRCRPPVHFDRTETQKCNKHYRSSRVFSPGILTVQCACSKPKLLG